MEFINKSVEASTYGPGINPIVMIQVLNGDFREEELNAAQFVLVDRNLNNIVAS